MKKTDRWIGMVVLLIGVIWTYLSLKLPLKSNGLIGPGFWPLIIGLSLTVLGIAQSILANSKVEEPPDWPRGLRLQRILVITVSFAIYLIIIRWLGFTISNIIFFIVIIRFWGGYSWKKVGILSVSLSLALHIVFFVWLNMSLPKGVF